MSVLVFAESQNGSFKKAAFETVTYGAKTAAALGVECVALTLGTAKDAGQLGVYGASKVFNIADAGLDQVDSQVYTQVIAAVAEQVGAQVVIVPHSSTGKSILGRLAARMNAGSVAGANAVPTVDGGFKVLKGVFSGKAIATIEVKSPVKLISLMGNSLQPEATGSA
ncbi:MAG: electron transfer flavoprotein subunit alpha/FixB family protein, partial [Phaeodactylibacter sp.]|nr:electron transfer flavoprotein subunit alpha/FixB family protein [Phaeodactylibacter sp.]